MLSFNELWRNACEENTPQPDGAAGDLVAAFATLFDAEQVEFAQLGEAALFLCDLSKLGFAGMDLTVVMVTHPCEDLQANQALRELLRQYREAAESVGFCLHIVLSEQVNATRLFDDVVTMCQAEMERLFASKLPAPTLFAVMCSQVDIRRLCPFNTSREARGVMFKGRRLELGQLTSALDTNFVVSGARRIGKTSLLRKAYDALRIRSEFRGQTFYFNCITWGGFEDCCNRIAHLVEPKKELRMDKGLRNAAYMLQRRSLNGTKPLLFFFDELDRVVNRDATVGWPFFRLLAEATSSRWVRAVMAGYRSISRLTYGKDGKSFSSSMRDDTPFHGAIEELFLEPLSYEDTRSLILDPFDRIKISVHNTAEIHERVWQGTRGYPFLVQFYGEELYRNALHRGAQEISIVDLETIETGYRLSDFLESHFLENTIENGRPAKEERLCAFLYARANPPEPWAEGDFLAACQAEGYNLTIDKIHRALRNLYHANIVAFENERYPFTFPLLGKILRTAFPDLNTVLNSLGGN